MLLTSGNAEHNKHEERGQGSRVWVGGIEGQPRRHPPPSITRLTLRPSFSVSLPLESEIQAPSSSGPGVLRWVPVIAVGVVAIGGYFFWARAHSVDRALVGRWGNATPSRTGAMQSTFAIGSDTRYELETEVRDHGRLVASNGQFRMISSTQASAAGTYRPLDPTSLEVTSALGKVVWKRTSSASTDPRTGPMTGQWESVPIIAGVVWHQTIDVAPDSTYTLSSITADSGRIATSAGTWRMISRSGHESEGTYQLKGREQLVFTAPQGQSTWRRALTRP
jgi:hypothetical protein